MYGYVYSYSYGKIGEATPTPDWTTIIFSDGNDLVFSDNNNLGYGV